ncbi:hypothetical protein CMV_007288 [Castanea mollissima]|uniref:Transmembrane protein n=1 Tax=Castanea mollissima TaxID=60419 RepID=A0A8J4RV63_9ROSI|nr:hypothetical protein CMV_007288 [Castanea mollissima]
MEARKEDLRIYIISFLFFSCIVCGGVFLSIYLFLPQSQSSSWYPIVGLILVGVPWLFWFLAYLYRCIKPRHDESEINQGGCNNDGPCPPAVSATSDESPLDSPGGGGGERRVHFGAVIVLGKEADQGVGQGGHDIVVTETNVSQCNPAMDEHERHHDNKGLVGFRESEMPLSLKVSS